MSIVRRVHTAVAMAGVLLAATGTAGAAVIHVDAAAPPGGNGQTWATAFRSLQDALDIAVANDQIWVAAGTYQPTDQVDPWDVRTVTFQLFTGVAIYGAFPPGGGNGTFGARDVDNPAYETILSGDIGTPGSNSDNAYHVVTGSGTDVTAILDGFTITAGNASGPSSGGWNYGGGMYNSGGSPSVANCTISENTAGYGGGVCCANSSSPMLINCALSGNSASAGNYGCGGGVYCSGSNPTLINCTFSMNRAPFGGGVCCTNSSSPTLSNCTISGNTSIGTMGSSGGGVYCEYSSSPILSNCSISGNTAGSGRGGGAYCWYSSPMLTNCTITGNTASDGGGGVYCTASSNPTLRHRATII